MDESVIVVDDSVKKEEKEKSPFVEVLSEGPSSSGELIKSEMDMDKCAICLTDNFIRPTVALPCKHPFCYLCLKSWLGFSKDGTCPVCKTVITTVEIKDEEEITTIDRQTLLAEIEAEKNAELGDKYPMNDELALINKKIHAQRVRINIQNEYASKSGRKPRSRDTQNCIQLLTGLQSLKDQIRDSTIRRVDLIGDPKFRAIIYEQPVEWYLVEPDAMPNRKSFNKNECKANVEQYQARLLPWLEKEISFIHRRNKERMDDEIMAQAVFQECLKTQVHSPDFSKFLQTYVDMSPSNAETFSIQLYELASSQLTVEAFYAVSGFRYKTANNNNFNVGGLQEPRRTRRHQPEDVVTLDDDVNDVIIEEPSSSQQLNIGPMTSDSDSNEVMFGRASCRLPPLMAPRSIFAHDRFGVNFDISNQLLLPAFRPYPAIDFNSDRKRVHDRESRRQRIARRAERSEGENKRQKTDDDELERASNSSSVQEMDPDVIFEEVRHNADYRQRPLARRSKVDNSEPVTLDDDLTPEEIQALFQQQEESPTTSQESNQTASSSYYHRSRRHDDGRRPHRRRSRSSHAVRKIIEEKVEAIKDSPSRLRKWKTYFAEMKEKCEQMERELDGAQSNEEVVDEIADLNCVDEIDTSREDLTIPETQPQDQTVDLDMTDDEPGTSKDI